MSHPGHDELRDLEARLTADDPKLAAKLTMANQTRRWRFVLLLADLTAIAMVAVGVFAGDASAVFFGMILAAALLWVHRAARTRPRGETFPRT
ncbi:DUF3040 domain-containing protein [Amycolatopsis sp. cmx-4-54]|uniref:DUF3040 domain-containing protein n=1 Tax=Amycolatopsis sp. cmx-4-54 TaxID=2790936 RepID=UPI00397E4720